MHALQHWQFVFPFFFPLPCCSRSPRVGGRMSANPCTPCPALSTLVGLAVAIGAILFPRLCAVERGALRRTQTVGGRGGGPGRRGRGARLWVAVPFLSQPKFLQQVCRSRVPSVHWTVGLGRGWGGGRLAWILSRGQSLSRVPSRLFGLFIYLSLLLESFQGKNHSIGFIAWFLLYIPCIGYLYICDAAYRTDQSTHTFIRQRRESWRERETYLEGDIHTVGEIHTL